MLQETNSLADPVLTAAEQKRLLLADRLLQIAREEQWQPGHRLLEQHLAEQLDVSRSPVRALLKFLADQRVVTLEPGRGASFQLSVRMVLVRRTTSAIILRKLMPAGKNGWVLEVA